ncbi:MAG TPA: hypothetical protein VKA67_03650, partial [Verrucomicrobiae bacterium]|nr:hypothetical protein [Verrucomicrobiae bacterium]
CRCMERRPKEKEVVLDTTVQEKNITHPTDTKLTHQIIRRCWKLADQHRIRLGRRYRQVVRAGVMAQRWRRDPRKRKAAHRALRKMKVRAGRLIRELERKLPAEVREEQRENFALYRRVLAQQPSDGNKIYSLHETRVRFPSPAPTFKITNRINVITHFGFLQNPKVRIKMRITE